MRFLLNDLRGGELRIAEGPSPALTPRSVRVGASASLVSTGTERMLVDFGRANMLAKATQQPDRLRELIDKARREGVADTVAAVRAKLDQPIPLGYANAGVVLEVGAEVRGIRPGQLVATNGPHADEIVVPSTFAVPAPEGVTPEQACFASVAAVGLQGIRLAQPEVGERVVVTGLGLVGLLSVQLLLAQGCAVLGIDPDPRRRDLAASFGALAAPPQEAESVAAAFSRGRGVDAVLVCASTSSSDPIRSGARMSRQRGRVVLVGMTGLDLDRSELYEKELSLQVSASYGPGRYDPAYEAGHDLSPGLVRWTAGRNMEAVLDLLAARRLDTEPLLTHVVDFDDAARAYDLLSSDPATLGIVLRYGATVGAPPIVPPVVRSLGRAASAIATPGRLALVGAGNFATRTLGPAISAAGGDLTVVVGRSGAATQVLADALGAEASTDLDAVLADPAIGAVFVTTRHDSHAALAAKALEAGKAAYVEKPLVLNEADLDALDSLVTELSTDRLPVLTVGFNRRWAPITVRMRELLAGTTVPMAIVITVNAGHLPAGHWTQDPAVGGGRIIGEACHFVDLARHLAGANIEEVRATPLGGRPTGDSTTITLSFTGGSTATIHYLATGSPRLPKERVEVFHAGRTMVNDDFRRLRVHGWPRRAALGTWGRPDKGHQNAVAAFIAAARAGGPAPIPWNEIVEVHRATITAARAR